MAIRIEWDEFEIALLIEACEEVLRKGKPKSEVVKTVSSNLRKRAISKNIAIDDVFRNENGIALQMQKMAYLLTHGEKGMPGASKLYAEVAELREENPKKFEEILKRAKEEIEMTDLSQQNIDKKALFAQWLNEHPIKKYTPSAIIDALDVASRYCVSKKVCKDGFWSMQNKAEFNAVASKLLSFRLFRLKYRSAAAKMDKAIPLYKAFLDSYVASREENTAEFEGEALNEPDSMLSTAAANSDDIIRLDFSDIGSLVFSRPVCLNYKDHTFTDFNSWASLYAKVAFLLKQDYPQIIVDGESLSEGAAPEFSMNSKALRKPKAITDGLFIETNHSATEIASRIATLLRLCGVDLNEVSITYTLKKEAEQKRTSQARSENEKLYEKLYSISRIYDDPAGLSLNRITGLLGRSDDRELVQGILDHAPWAHRIENGIYSFASADTISARNEKKAGKDDTISDSAFYDYLDKTLCMAEPTCRSYVSAIRSAEKYAKDYGFTSYRIYDVTTSDAVALLNALMRDDGFAAYNIRQHNRFRAAFTKFAEMAGQSIVVKKTGAQLQNKPQEQPIAPFDKEKYIEILMCRYRNGITFDSIDFDNFRETYEDLYDSSIDADDDTLEKQLRLCGVFYNNRLFPAEGIMDDETREKLFTYIENSFSSGKKVLYYKAVFEDLADAFANCYSLADEHRLSGKIKLVGFKNFCPYTVDLDYYKEMRSHFTIDEWIDVLLGAIDYNADGYESDLQKLSMLTRLLPFVEKRVNLIELAPKGTGKSYVFGHVSKYGLLVDGGKITRTKMFYDANRRKPGYICGPDFLAIDEVKLVNFGDENEMRSILQGYLEYGTFNANGYNGESDAGVVFLGNIKEEKMNEYEYMLGELPTLFQETALLDRIHGFVKGWDIPRMNDSLKVTGWALNSEYFCSILHELRNDMSYSAIVEKLVKGPDDADTRDAKAIKKIATAYLKLLFPNVQSEMDVDKTEFRDYCLIPAMRMRRIIKLQQGFIDTEYKGKDVPFFTVDD